MNNSQKLLFQLCQILFLVIHLFLVYQTNDGKSWWRFCSQETALSFSFMFLIVGVDLGIYALQCVLRRLGIHSEVVDNVLSLWGACNGA